MPNDTEGMETITTRRMANKCEFVNIDMGARVCTVYIWLMFMCEPVKTMCTKELTRNILGKLTENKAKRERDDDDDMTQHDRCKYSKMEYCIMSQELLRETNKTIYIYMWMG